MGVQSPNSKRRWPFFVAVLMPVAICLVATVAITLGFVLWSAQGVDERALARQTMLATHIIETQLSRIPHDQESVTIWDDSIINTKFALDTAWIDTNLGQWMSTFFGHDDVIIVDNKDQPIYAMSDGRMSTPEAGRAQMPTLQPLIDRLRGKIAAGGLVPYENGAIDHPPRVSDLTVVEGIPSLVSVAPIISDSTQIKQAPGTEFLHISVVHLDADYARRLSDEYLIPDATFTSAASGGQDIAALPLTNSSGRFITFFDWSRARPGAALVNETVPVIAGAFLIAALLAVVLIHQLWRKSRDLEVGQTKAAHQAAHDALTGLPNRGSFDTSLTQALTQRLARDRRTSILLLDLDRFKQVNDTLGHRAGDDLIRAVGQRLSQLVNSGETVARLGGDEFAIIHTHPPGLGAPLHLSTRIIEAIGKPFEIFGSEAFVGVSIGIATAEGDDVDAHDLVRKADIALYEAKASGRNRAVVFEEPMNELLQNRKTIEVELREALRRNDQLSVAFQPLFSEDRTIIGAEALARWTHPQLGQISPAHFVPVAESSGLIGALGTFVLRRACELGAKWPGHTIAVNISPAQLLNATFPSDVFELLASTGMRATDLELEITEGILLEEASEAAEALRVFRSAGIKIALDDFGTGYSSLNYLKRYPVDRVKIDRSFVSQLAPGSVSVAIVQAMVTLAHALRIEVTAEGVETIEQMNVLKSLGCNVYQGFLLSAPIAPEALERLLRQPEARVA